MKFDDLTLGEIKQIQSMFGKEAGTESKLFDEVIGKYVIVRTRNEGVNAGYVVRADASGVVLKRAKRLHRLISKDKNLIWYEGVSKSGLDPESRVSGETELKVIVEDYSLTLCTKEAEESIVNFECEKTTC